ncbi:SulP family inorganic anion transporter [Cohnella yongneupensis]|uniref:SulP family inorganic anion transporter n=1 Tax=Cohnella yongneupensis TaxID=425006 RepID=A0ABW0R4X2_9BACL
MNRFREIWLFNWKGDVLSGVTSTLALIPGAIAFSFIAGVSPMVGIYATICLSIALALCGARPAMLTAAAGSMAVLMTPLVKEHGIDYLFAATVLTGIIQLLIGLLRLGRWMDYVPRAVITGFINALAVMILVTQLKYFSGERLPMYAIVIGTLVIIYLWPRVSKPIPSPLVAVIVMTGIMVVAGLQLTTVGDEAPMTAAFPAFHWPDIPFNWHTLGILLPYSLSLALVGYGETLLTQSKIDELLGERTSKDKEMRGQGLGNMAAGLFGGMAGCALVAESIINTKLGGKGRLSNLTAGIVLLLLVVGLGGTVSAIPMAALVGVMLFVSFEIFEWSSLLRVRQIAASETAVMASTALCSVITHNLAIGMLAGIGVHLLLRTMSLKRGVDIDIDIV